MPAVTVDQILRLSAAPAPVKAKAKKATKPVARKALPSGDGKDTDQESVAPAALASIAVVQTTDPVLTADVLATLNPGMPSPPVRVAGGPCTRCDGTGQKAPYGKCFRCEGDGNEPDRETAKRRWEEGQVRKAKAEKRRSANEQQCDVPASLADIVAWSNGPAPAAVPEAPTAPVAIAAGKEALKLAIADAVIGLGSPDNLPPAVQKALLAFYMAR